MKEHFCPAEQSMIAFEKECNWCGEKEALAQTQEPVAWLLTDKNINSIQVDSIQRLINRLNHAHHTDLCVRINGQDEWFQADWLKHMVRATPPQRTWVGLTDEEVELYWDWEDFQCGCGPSTLFAMIRDIESRLKDRNI
jgi:hypothetical protein